MACRPFLGTKYDRWNEMDEKKEEVVSEALKAEERLRSKWYLLDIEGKLVP